MAEEHFVPLSLLPPSRTQQTIASSIAAALLLIVIASQPFAQIHLVTVNTFAPVVAAIEIVSYFFTATLLFASYSVQRIPALLALATGYVFTGLVMIAWVFSFPGAFAIRGLLGTSPQISFYLAYFVNGGLGISSLVYAALKNAEAGSRRSGSQVPFATLVAVILASATTFLVVRFADDLPPMMIDEVHVSTNWAYVAPFFVALYIAAIASVVYRRTSVLDIWLLLALWGWLLESVMLLRFHYRFTVGWYVSLFFEFFSGSVVLVALLSQLTTLYGRLAISMTALQRERENRMLTVDVALASVAHEANQPISAIVTNGTAGLRQLARGNPDIPELTAILTDIIADGHRATDAINAIRAMFRTDGNERSALDVADLLGGVLALVKGDLQARNIALETAIEARLPRVAGNKTQLQQVLLNLIVNAAEAMDEVVAKTRRLRIGATRDGEAVLVTLQDTGPGIDPKLAERMFEPFVTTKSKGTGLGLSICRSIVEAHGGKLLLMAAIPQGAVVQFTLPIAEAA